MLTHCVFLVVLTRSLWPTASYFSYLYKVSIINYHVSWNIHFKVWNQKRICDGVFYIFKWYYADQPTVWIYIYVYVELCEAALNYNIQHSGSVCCISSKLSIDSVLDIPSSSGGGRGGRGPVKDDVKQQQKICQKLNDICLKESICTFNMNDMKDQ